MADRCLKSLGSGAQVSHNCGLNQGQIWFVAHVLTSLWWEVRRLVPTLPLSLRLFPSWSSAPNCMSVLRIPSIFYKQSSRDSVPDGVVGKKLDQRQEGGITGKATGRLTYWWFGAENDKPSLERLIVLGRPHVSLQGKSLHGWGQVKMNKESKLEGVKGHKSKIQLLFLSMELGFGDSWEDLDPMVFYELKVFCMSDVTVPCWIISSLL